MDRIDGKYLGQGKTTAIIEPKEYGFKIWLVIGTFSDVRSGYAVESEHGDRMVIYEDEVTRIAAPDLNFKYYSFTGDMARKMERGIDEWTEKNSTK